MTRPNPPDEGAPIPAAPKPEPRRRARAAAKVPATASAEADAALVAPAPGAPGGPLPGTLSSGDSRAALVAVLLFAWGESLLAFEWARQRFFEPLHASPLVLTFPFFGAAVIAAFLAVRSRAAGRSALGGPVVQALGIASGILAIIALSLALWLGPRLLQAQEDVRVLRAVRQVEDVAAGLASHRSAAARYPDATSVRQLLPILAPRLAPRIEGAELSSVDPWGHELEYRSLSEGRGYLLVSSGPDGSLDIPLLDYVQSSRAAISDDDIVVLNGTFVSTGLGGLFGGPRAWQGQDKGQPAPPSQPVPQGTPK